VIVVSPAKNLLAVGGKRQMSAKRVFPGGAQGDATTAVTWSSSDASVVGIVASGASGGLATGLKPGVAKIVAFDPVTGVSSDGAGGTSAKLSVAGDPKLVLIFPRPDPTTGNLAATVGVPFQLKARVDFTGGATQGINNLVDWLPSDPSVLHISDGTDGDPAGWAKPLKAGSITVRITYPKASGPPPPFPPSQPLSDVITVLVRPAS
jgi:hypothetical protein